MDDHIGHFLNFMSVEKGASGNTVAAYKNDLQQFEVFLVGISGNGRPRDWEQLQRDIIIDYLGNLKQRNYAEATVARKVAALKSFFQYMQAEGVIRRNPAESLESPRVGRSLLDILGGHADPESLDLGREPETSPNALGEIPGALRKHARRRRESVCPVVQPFPKDRDGHLSECRARGDRRLRVAAGIT